MKKILILGAGEIVRPLVRYLLDLRDYHLVIGTLDVGHARTHLAL
jgi:hypothetical protein